ncbi:hypothetical protein [Nocardia sp. NRRL S-836]|uniref:hypothetical protein n=1 Tax=Nocardia sp. NRRL S-836 TaxID=1519492 RepID=UPI0012F9FC34|nr:hypothetical protein [Nocardia sp. NRRL S-836]
MNEQQKEPQDPSRIDTPWQTRRTQLFAHGFDSLLRTFGGPPSDRARAAVQADLFGGTAAPRAAG